MKKYFKTLIFLSLFLPGIIFGQVVITEIMYDAVGADTGREWIEVLNSGTTPVDLSQWKLFEANTNHSLLAFQGDLNLVAGEYAIIADNPAKFLIDWPSFSKQIFDSSFSLSNTGETLILRDENGIDKDTVTYQSDVGGNGDGNSIHRNGGTISVGLPSPGVASPDSSSQTGSNTNSTTGSSNVSETSSSISSESQSSTSSSGASGESSNFTISIGKDRVSAVGNPVIFRAEVKNTNSGAKRSPSFEWSLGDGSLKYGQEIEYNYRYPGDYIVVLNSSFGDERVVARVGVRVFDPNLTVSASLDGSIEIVNNASQEMNLYNWKIATGEKAFIFPKDTIIKSKSKIILAQETSGLTPNRYVPIKIFYPLGLEYISSQTQKLVNVEEVKKITTLNTDGKKTAVPDEKRQTFQPENLKGEETLTENQNDESSSQTAAVGKVFEVKKPKSFWTTLVSFFKNLFN